MSATERYLRYSAPVENGQLFSAPPWNAVGELLASNLAVRATRSADIQGRSLLELAAEARQDTLAAAMAYTSKYADVDQYDAKSPLILTGHQPELVHPGVWLKDFAASRIARQAKGTALSLIIDSDLCRAASIRVPTGRLDCPRVEYVAYDQAVDPVPLEERQIVDRATWDSFGLRVSKTIKPFIASPLIEDWTGGTNGPFLATRAILARRSLVLVTVWSWNGAVGVFASHKAKFVRRALSAGSLSIYLRMRTDSARLTTVR